MCRQVQPVAFGVSFDLSLQSQSPWSLFNGTWQKRRRKLDHRLSFEIGEMTLQMQQDLYIQKETYKRVIC